MKARDLEKKKDCREEKTVTQSYLSHSCSIGRLQTRESLNKNENIQKEQRELVSKGGDSLPISSYKAMPTGTNYVGC